MVFNNVYLLQRQLSCGGLTSELTADLESKKKNLEDDLQLRTAQISDLQSKIMDDDEGTYHVCFFINHLIFTHDFE